jgi:hypothetical protein
VNQRSGNTHERIAPDLFYSAAGSAYAPARPDRRIGLKAPDGKTNVIERIARLQDRIVDNVCSPSIATGVAFAASFRNT